MEFFYWGLDRHSFDFIQYCLENYLQYFFLLGHGRTSYPGLPSAVQRATTRTNP
jgi:hypothetical protein